MRNTRNMKAFKVILTACMAVGLLTIYAADTDGIYVWKNGSYTHFDEGDIVFSDTLINIADTKFSVNDIDSITFTQPAEVATVTDTVCIVYDGQTATVSPASVEGITAEVDGATVTLTNENTDREMTFVLSGESSAGSFTYNGTYKTCIQLAGLSLQSTTGAALDIRCGKRIALELLDGTENSLCDATTDLGQKAALYCKGHLEVSKGGTLSVTGNIKHGISTKEYMLVKSTTGLITVNGAASDGIHAGQYFKMNGGTINILGVKGDGIQAEATGDGDEDDGQLMLRGGKLSVATTERDVAAIKSDSLLTITGGSITIHTTGDGNKGLKSKTDISISGGELEVVQSGKYIVENNDPGYVVAIKAGGNLDISGGTITINNTAEAGKGLSADGNITTSEDSATLTIGITANGTGAALDLSRNVDTGDEGGDTGGDEQTVYRICAALSSSTSQYWNQVVYLYSSDGTRIAQLTKTITVAASGQTTRTFFYYDFDEPTTGQFYFASDDYTRTGGGGGGGWGGPGGGGGQTYTIRTTAVGGPTESKPDVYYYINTTSPSRSGTVYTFTVTDYTSRYSGGTITDSGSVSSGSSFATAAGIKSDGSISIGGGNITIGSTGAAAKGISCEKELRTTGGTLTITNSGNGLGSGNNTATAKGLTSDESINLVGGNITIKMTGTGGKGIKSDGTLTIGNADEGPVLNVTTTGAKYANTSSAKAIKATGAITVNGGELTVSTSTAGAEGMESKLKSRDAVVINGGKLYFKCYDDCINTAGCIRFEGGVTVCYGYGNDSVDSNYGQAGAITIGNGAVMAYTTKGSPEEGFDCDNNSYIQITGYGIGISAGGAQGGGGGWGGSSGGISSAVQGYYLSTSSISYATGRYYTLSDASGNNLVTYSFEASVSSSLSLITATGMKKGSTYSLKYSTAKPTDASTEWHGLYLGSTAKGTTNVVNSITAQ